MVVSFRQESVMTMTPVPSQWSGGHLVSGVVDQSPSIAQS